VNGKSWIKKQGTGGKSKVLTLVERGGGARSLKAEHLTAPQVRAFIEANTSPKSRLHTDEAKH